MNLATAISIAADAHLVQTDKAGKAYILHPLRAMMRLRTDDEELMSIAVLHDVVEDVDYWTIEQLKGCGFSDRVCNALDCLTHREGENYDSYIARIAANEDAILCKIEDLRDNSDIMRLKGLRQKDFKRIEKYHRAFAFLQNALLTIHGK